MSSSEYIYPTKRGRIIYSVLIVVTLATYFIGSLLAEDIRTVTDIEDIKVGLITLCIVASLFYAYLGFWLVIFGKRIIREKRYPPQGLPLAFRTKIQYGKLAFLQGIASYMMSLIMLLFSVIFIHTAWQSYGL